MPMRRRASDTGEATQVVGEPTAPLPAAAEPPPPGAPVEEPPPDRELWPWLVVLLILALAAVIGAWWASRHNGDSSTTGAPPQTVVTAPGAKVPARIAVPRVVGLQAPAALVALRRAGLTGTTRGAFSEKPANHVVAQSPAPGARVRRGGTVTLDVSKGRKPVAVPDVTGQQVAAALDTLRVQGLRANVVRVPSDQAAGQVLAQHPKGGATAPSGSAVRLNVATTASSGQTTTTAPASPAPPPAVAAVTVPDVRGQKVNDARKQLRGVGLVLEIRKVPSSLPKNSVVSQSPRPDAAAKRGDHVLVTVSRGAPKGKKRGGGPAAAAATSMPDVTGEDEASATQDLEAAGFDVQSVDQETTDESEDGLVVGQDPTAGGQAAAGSQVTIYVGRFGG